MRPKQYLLTILTAGLIPFSSIAANIGETFPDLSQHNLQGALPDLKGKVVLVDFFASWCAPCRLSFPAMQDLENRYKEKGFAVIAISVDKKQGDMEAFVKKLGTNFAVVRDSSTKLVSAVKVPTMPTSFLLDKEGRIAAIHNGFHGEESKIKCAQEIEALLK